MARGKTKIALIEDEKVLKSTFRKRKDGLIKKVKELTTLCDIIACIVIYGPVIGGRPPKIFTWPEDQDRVRAAISMYKEKEGHSRRTADLCYYLKNRRRLDLESDMSEDHHQGNMALYGGGFYKKWDMRPEVAMTYLKWVDERIKAVDERIDLVKNANSMLFGNNDQCQRNMLFGDIMQLVPVNKVDQVENLGYGFWQEYPYLHNHFGDFSQFDADVHDQTLCGPDLYNHSVYRNLVPAAIQYQQSFEQNAITCYQQKRDQDQDQMRLFDPYLLGVEQSNTMTMRVDNTQQYQQQYGENMQYLSNVAQTQAQPQPPMSSIMYDMMGMRPYADDWSSPDAPSSNYSSSSSNQFHKAAMDDPLENFLAAAEFVDVIQPLGDAAGAGETIPSSNGV